MANLLIDQINDDAYAQLDNMAVHFGESPTELARFLLAASLYHAHKMSFHAAATLSGLGFNGFKQRLNDYFSTGYMIAPEVIDDDMKQVMQLLNDK